MWLKLAPGQSASQLRLSIERRTAGTPTYQTLVADTTVTDAAWAHFAGSYTRGTDVDFLSVYAESASGTASFYLDDFEMAFVRPLPIQTDILSVKDVLADDFLAGAAVEPAQTLGVHGELLAKH